MQSIMIDGGGSEVNNVMRPGCPLLSTKKYFRKSSVKAITLKIRTCFELIVKTEEELPVKTHGVELVNYLMQESQFTGDADTHFPAL